MQNAPWVESTNQEVDFIIEKLQLSGKERVLDLACGFGRHSLEFSRRGYEVIGTDLTSSYIEIAKQLSKKEGLSAEFFRADIREINFSQEFDVILNMADGAIGYLENDAENLKIFDVISQALKRGSGKHFMSLLNGAFYRENCPIRTWSEGRNGILLSQHEWLMNERRVVHTGRLIGYGQVVTGLPVSDRVAHL